MKEGLRKLKGVNISTEIGEIILCDTYREGIYLLIKMTVNLTSYTLVLSMIPLQLRFMIFIRKNLLIDSIMRSKLYSIQRCISKDVV